MDKQEFIEKLADLAYRLVWLRNEQLAADLNQMFEINPSVVVDDRMVTLVYAGEHTASVDIMTDSSDEIRVELSTKLESTLAGDATLVFALDFQIPVGSVNRQEFEELRAASKHFASSCS